MIRTVVKVDKQRISFDVPRDYIGKDVEIIAFAIDEADDYPEISDKPFTHFASEKVLAKDWLSPEEDKAWRDL